MTDQSADGLDHDSVLEYLRENEPAGQAEIAKALLDIEVRCSECGKRTDEYEEAVTEVKSVLRELHRDGLVLSSPGFNWEVTSRGR